jgi:hypothetical protein
VDDHAAGVATVTAPTAWCPRCDAVREQRGACPDCGTPLTVLGAAPSRPAADQEPPPAPAEPISPPAPSRLRLAALAVTVALAAAAFLAGRGGARAAPAPAAAPSTAAPTTAGGVASALDDRRELGWRVRSGGVALTVVSARRVAGDDDDVRGELTIRVDGLPAGRVLFGLTGLGLVDAGGGAFSTPPERPLAGPLGTPVQPADQPGSYTVDVGRAPGLGALAHVELDGLVVSRPAAERIRLPAGGPWPRQPPLRRLEGVSHGAVPLPPGRSAPGPTARLATAFVGAGKAVVIIDFRQDAGGDFDAVPVSARLDAGGRPLCARATAVGRSSDPDQETTMVLACPAQPGRPLTLALGAGVETRAFRAALEP